jgi:hypothetical protein
MSILGHGLPLRAVFTARPVYSDRRRLAATPMSAGSGRSTKAPGGKELSRACRIGDTEGVDMKSVLQIGLYVIGIILASFGAKGQWGDHAAIFVIGLLLCVAVLVERVRGARRN